nr:hypothetical protein KPHV_23550 [Kitasatospora purpeofusca]
MLGEDRAPDWGKLAMLDNDVVSKGSSPEQLVLDRALADLAEAAGRDDRIASARGRPADGLHTRAAAVAPGTAATDWCTANSARSTSWWTRRANRC